MESVFTEEKKSLKAGILALSRAILRRLKSCVIQILFRFIVDNLFKYSHMKVNITCK